MSTRGARIIEAVGYAGGSEVPVFQKTYAVEGTGTWISSATAAGDSAFLTRYSTNDRSSKNHPVYCFNYYHAPQQDAGAGGQDILLSTQRTAAQTYASSWVTGFSDGATNHIRSRPNGNAVNGSLVELMLTHRDLPR